MYAWYVFKYGMCLECMVFMVGMYGMVYMACMYGIIRIYVLIYCMYIRMYVFI